MLANNAHKPIIIRKGYIMTSHEINRQGVSPLILKPSNPALIKRLELKSAEYAQRFSSLGEYTHPEQLLVETFLSNNRDALDALLKARLLDKVLSDAEVKIWEFQEQVITDPLFKIPLEINQDLFVSTMLNACLVIDAYCSEDQEQIRGGTGLPSIQ
jgi:hypothetical protein